MIGEEKPRDLAALIIPRAGWLEHAEDPWEPYRLGDRGGTVVGPVAVYLRDLQASARPETTLRAYSTALLRWFRFLWAIEVPWDQATRAEARDFCCWIQLTVKPGRAGRRDDAGGAGLATGAAAGPGGGLAGVPNPGTGKAPPGRGYASATGGPRRSVLPAFSQFPPLAPTRPFL